MENLRNKKNNGISLKKRRNKRLLRVLFWILVPLTVIRIFVFDADFTIVLMLVAVFILGSITYNGNTKKKPKKKISSDFYGINKNNEPIKKHSEEIKKEKKEDKEKGKVIQFPKKKN